MNEAITISDGRTVTFSVRSAVPESPVTLPGFQVKTTVNARLWLPFSSVTESLIAHESVNV